MADSRGDHLNALGTLRLAVAGRAFTVTERADGRYAWRVDDPASSDWAHGLAPDALSALRAAAAAAERLPATQRAIRGHPGGAEAGEPQG